MQMNTLPIAFRCNIIGWKWGLVATAQNCGWMEKRPRCRKIHCQFEKNETRNSKFNSSRERSICFCIIIFYYYFQCSFPKSNKQQGQGPLMTNLTLFSNSSLSGNVVVNNYMYMPNQQQQQQHNSNQQNNSNDSNDEWSSRWLLMIFFFILFTLF